MNYYKLFELEETPTVDKQILAQKYVDLQKKHHPDFFTTDTETAQEEALEISAHINKAYNIFKNKDKTLAYFLEQKGIITADEKYNLPQDFLMEMMELNENLEDDDTAEEKISAFENSLEEEIKPLLQKDKVTLLTEENLLQLKAYYYKKKYLQRILERLDD